MVPYIYVTNLPCFHGRRLWYLRVDTRSGSGLYFGDTGESTNGYYQYCELRVCTGDKDTINMLLSMLCCGPRLCVPRSTWYRYTAYYDSFKITEGLKPRIIPIDNNVVYPILFCKLLKSIWNLSHFERSYVSFRMGSIRLNGVWYKVCLPGVLSMDEFYPNVEEYGYPSIEIHLRFDVGNSGDITDVILRPWRTLV